LLLLGQMDVEPMTNENQARGTSGEFLNGKTVNHLGGKPI
jgi:hypothetical protein